MTQSWIIREKATGRVIAETFKANVAAAINTKRYEAVSAHQHLAEMNADLQAKREASYSATIDAWRA